MATLAVEFTTSRMLQTVYGTSNIVWANVIGLVLLFLTLGYFLGGRLADRYPQPRLFYSLVALAGFSSVFFLLLTSVILRQAASALASVHVGAVVSSLVAVVLALAAPVTLLGCISPFAIRLGVRTVAEAGRVSGRIYAISTWGSLLGTYLPVLLTIPEAGSRLTAVIFGGVLLLMGLGGLWQSSPRLGLAGLLLPALLGPFVAAWTAGQIKEYPGQVFETESAYNYIQVIREEDCNYLLLNEGQAYHSFYCESGRVPRISVWSIMLAAPYFNEPAAVGGGPVQNLAVIGLAAGTIPKQFTQVFGPIPIDGIELDPEIVAAGRTYFALNEPNINVIVGDGRYELNQLDGRYDVITLDAYKVPYIPWHLTTREFFEEVKVHLSERGALAINVGRVPNDRRLVEAVTATLLTVFPTVHTIDVPGSLNSILVATVRPTAAGNVAANLALLPAGTDPLLVVAVQTAANNLVPTVASEVVFTDERAPVETMIDSIVIRFLLEEGPESLPSIGG
ncbi:MAG: fused MFS/spermidine synthase [Chloroflexi bacterium]|nr:fused MFS/spermidine synthase [Chloroflexota bacterium]MCI0580320.1 fused MFS/spermidine synthase [Chloroflexota bacterium]MCI0648533.1 fused MFS/spermidine synthase [Chloroflexota bacterium]MCI0728487.1 fused MFS/spermidine synthase [Chloroflexota bacterium]